MADSMNKKQENFSEKYDQLFEKPKVKFLEDRKIRIMVLAGVIVTGLMMTLPYLFSIVVLNGSEAIIERSQKKIDEIKASQPFVEVPIFKENLTVPFPPNYNNVEKYKLQFDGKNLDFGNGYILELTDFSSIENKLSEYSIKPTEGYDTVNNLLTVVSKKKQFSVVNDGKKHRYDQTNPFDADTYTPVRVTGNLLASMDMSKMKEKGSFLTLLKQKNIGDVQTGIVVNASPAHGLSDELGEIPQTYVVLTKYWLFPDGVGVMVDVSNNYLGNLDEKDDFSTLNDQKLKEIDEFTTNDYSWLENHFKMKRVQ